MKKIKICILILCSNMIFAQQNYFDNYQIRCMVAPMRIMVPII